MLDRAEDTAVARPLRLFFQSRPWLGSSLVYGVGATAATFMITLLIGTLALKDRRDVLHEAEVVARTVVAVLADHADRVVENSELVLGQAISIAAPRNGVVPSDDDTWRHLVSLQQRSPYVSGIWVGDAEGRAVLTTYVNPPPNLSAKGRDYFNSARDNPRTLFFGLLPRNQYTNTSMITATRRLQPTDGPFTGFVTVDIQPEQIRALYARLETGTPTYLWVLDPRFKPLIVEPQSVSANVDPAALERAFAPAKASTEGAFFAKSPASGDERLYVHKTSHYGLTLLLGYGTNHVLQGWYSRLWIYAISGIAGLLGIVALGGAGLQWMRRQTAYATELEARVAERTRALQEAISQKDVLLSELNHRVKNTLATVQSIAGNTIRGVSDLREFRQLFDSRLAALSSTHDLLMSSNWGSADLRALLEAELQPYLTEDSRRVTLDGPPIELKPSVALTLGLIFHELITNAVKYGALSAPDGHVAISWQLSKGASEVDLHWRERGGPAVESPRRQGFGSRLIERSIAACGGRSDMVFEPAGLRCSMTLPI